MHFECHYLKALRGRRPQRMGKAGELGAFGIRQGHRPDLALSLTVLTGYLIREPCFLREVGILTPTQDVVEDK